MHDKSLVGQIARLKADHESLLRTIELDGQIIAQQRDKIALLESMVAADEVMITNLKRRLDAQTLHATQKPGSESDRPSA